MTLKFKASSNTVLFSDVGEISCEELLAGKRTKDVIPNYKVTNNKLECLNPCVISFIHTSNKYLGRSEK
jgi:hypothetical protein